MLLCELLINFKIWALKLKKKKTKINSLLFTQFCIQLLTTWCKHQHLFSVVIPLFIHNWRLQRFSLGCWPLMLCVLILHVSGGTYSLKSTPKENFIYPQIFCQQSAKRMSPKKYFYFDVWPGVESRLYE